MWYRGAVASPTLQESLEEYVGQGVLHTRRNDQPKVPLHRAESAVASPNFPSLKKTSSPTGKRTTPSRPPSISARAMSSSSTTARPSPTARHTTATSLTGYVKDVVARYQTQQGKKVDREFGWDTHGLPAELEAEKNSGIEDKSEIETMGIEKFNDACRTSVLTYTKEWKEYVTRQARWVDFDNGYKTSIRPSWSRSSGRLRPCGHAGLVYEGYRVLPYCWNDETRRPTTS